MDDQTNEPTGKHHMIVDLFNVLGVKCSIAIQIERLMLSQRIVHDMIEADQIDADATIQMHMNKCLGMSCDQLLKEQNNDMLVKLVQLLCLRSERGIKFKGSGFHLDERMDNAVFLLPNKE